jgi:GT2 family glycosyltransferase
MNIAAVIVTYNRLNLLKECISALRNQTFELAQIIVVNNASTDGTSEWLDSQTDLVVVHQENLGGAGGFCTGIQTAYKNEHEWIWIMDDDAEPEIHCMENFVSVGLNEHYTYSPITVDKNTKKLCWPILVTDKCSGKRKYVEALAPTRDKTLQAYGYPGFLGNLFHRRVVELAGYPNADLFIRGDEAEFGARVNKAGFRSLFVSDAVLYHPIAKNTKVVKILGRQTIYSCEEPWKAFYNVRNVIYLLVHVNQNLVSAVLRIFFIFGTLLFEDQKLKRFSLYIRAIKDGFLGKLGKTITPP